MYRDVASGGAGGALAPPMILPRSPHAATHDVCGAAQMSSYYVSTMFAQAHSLALPT